MHSCHHVNIKLFESKKYGLAKEYHLRCSSEDCTWEKSFWSSAKPKNCRSFDITKRIIYAMRRIGVSLSGIKTFLK